MPQERPLPSPSPSTASSSKSQTYDYRVYHATTKENAESIIKENRFRLPTQKDAIERGLKLGAAVYFGVNPNYCLKEALNTLLETESRLLRQNNSIGLLSNADKIQIQNERLVCLEVDIELINGTLSIFSFGNYHDGQSGKQHWPLLDHHTFKSATTPKQPLLPNGDEPPESTSRLSSGKWDEATERLTADYLQTYYGIDALTINEETEHSFELAIYELDCIVNIQQWNINTKNTKNTNTKQ
ncbi:hypothetical protein FRACYDRAFT_249562 [Fragilariopsis cylindrus CCMP1102]|uniref:Uncharacterized protein n=1 Tax=Fragilariopsis cylindrus CCMP1102 TaxID=635003 RepID=A0A1E7ES13_9STRA|nr:hypothetical protein FRACYDRAFT_249562 [Fragilariopsis cylindrus CCMP1102]|eukprot:OEU08662.1 hypothetical protein FRACYDRAFT_249562 [Fragilariopsis cylindrus CCMP1102]